MVRAAFYDQNGLKKGAWSIEEDNVLRAFIEKNGHKNWRQLPKLAGLSRCGKSCRLRWKNYLQPNLKREKFTSAEEDIIMKLHEKLGNKWSLIAEQLRGRSDNEIKNHWHTHLKKRVKNKHETKPPADDDHELKEFLNNIEPPSDCETNRSFDSEISDITLDNYPSHSILGSSTLKDITEIYFEEYLSSLSFSYQALLSTYPITSTYSEEQQLVDYAAPMEIVEELISNEFWTQPYVTDKDIIQTMKFTESTVQSMKSTGII